MNDNYFYFFKLRDLRHENLNAFLGCYADPKTPSLVFEYATKGSLQVNLEAKKKS